MYSILEIHIIFTHFTETTNHSKDVYIRELLILLFRLIYLEAIYYSAINQYHVEVRKTCGYLYSQNILHVLFELFYFFHYIIIRKNDNTNKRIQFVCL